MLSALPALMAGSQRFNSTGRDCKRSINHYSLHTPENKAASFAFDCVRSASAKHLAVSMYGTPLAERCSMVKLLSRTSASTCIAQLHL